MHAVDAVVVCDYDEVGEARIVYVNPAFFAQTGYEPDEVVGRHPRLLVGPDSDHHAQMRLAEAAQERRPVCVEILHYRKDGSTYWVENSLNSVAGDDVTPAMIVSHQRDISERKATEERLRLSDIRLESLLSHTDDIITVLDADGTVRYSNPAAERFTGLAQGTRDGTSVFDAIHVEDQALAVATFNRALTTEGLTGPVEMRMLFADGEWHTVEGMANNRLADPAIRGLVVTLHDITERKVFEQQLTHQAFHDELTGLPNRALFADRLERALERSRRAGSIIAVLILDLDNFKVLNDSLGHHAGDHLLQQTATRLVEVVSPLTTVARFGGDEFVVLCEAVEGELHALEIADTIIAALADPFALDGVEVYVSASIGVNLPSPEADAESLVRDADTAMYRAKERGRGRAELFDDEMRERAMERMHLQNDLRRALERAEFVLHYQPEVSAGRLGLVVQHELHAFERTPQVVLKMHALHHAFTHLVVEELSAAAAPLLGTVHRRIAYQQLHVRLGTRQIHANARADVHLDTIEREGVGEGHDVFRRSRGRGAHLQLLRTAPRTRRRRTTAPRS